MCATLNRRRLLGIFGASAALGGAAFALRSLQDAPQPVRWSGEVLGAASAMTLWHPRPEQAQRTIARMLTEVDRLDRIFSLYRADSELVRLNRDGRIDAASRDLIAVTEASIGYAQASGGAFDPTIQPLWQFYAQHAQGRQTDTGLDKVLSRVGYQGIDIDGRRVAFRRDGMGVSLNGIAQGYITDRITDLLANEGFEQAMIELGETRALGTGPDAPFEVGIVDPTAPSRISRNVALADQALAVSGGYGLRLAEGHHIFNPATGLSPTRLIQVAVFAPKASAADALSTALYVAGAEAAPTILASVPGARATFWHDDGRITDA